MRSTTAAVIISLVLGATASVADAQGRLPSASALTTAPGGGTTEAADEQRTAALAHQLSAIIIPRIEFRATTIGHAIEFLRQQAGGANILLQLPAAAAPAPRPAAPLPEANIPGLPATTAAAASPPLPSANTRITLTLSRVPLLEALKYIASQAGLKVKVEPYAVSLVPLTDVVPALVTAVFRVPPNFIPNTTSSASQSALDQPATAAH